MSCEPQAARGPGGGTAGDPGPAHTLRLADKLTLALAVTRHARKVKKKMHWQSSAPATHLQSQSQADAGPGPAPGGAPGRAGGGGRRHCPGPRARPLPGPLPLTGRLPV